MTNPDELNSVRKDDMECILMNAITDCMYKNNMMMECFDMAYEGVKDLYLKNARMPKSKGGPVSQPLGSAFMAFTATIVTSIKFFVRMFDAGIHKCIRTIGIRTYVG